MRTIRVMHTCLFLCTGNYYRSRYAEEFFNHHATRRALPWQAHSRGLARDLTVLGLEGTMSPLALETLRRRGIVPRAADRPPTRVCATDVTSARRIFALCEEEHRPMLEASHEGWHDRVEYLQVADVGFTTPGVALAAVERAVLQVLELLDADGPA